VIGWLDCAAGASGDMLLGALVDAGVPIDLLQATVDGLGAEPVSLRAEPVTRHGLGATRLHVETGEADPAMRTWRDVRALLDAADLPAAVRDAAQDVFARLARAEAGVHRVDPDEVHFHEVGALDALADVVGDCAGLHHLGLTSLTASRVTLGSGTAHGRHGVIPVPAPAVLALLSTAGAPVHSGPVAAEMCTPTGAALLAAHVDQWGPMPEMTVRATGHGAGGRDPAELPNLVRLVLGEPAPAGRAIDEALLIEANIDDLDPRLWPPAIAALLAAGASDAWLTPIVMKKGRPAHTLHVLTPVDDAATVRTAIFTHTSTIGVRESTVAKHALERRHCTVNVGGQEIRIKVAELAGAVTNAAVEYEDAAAAARELGIPVKVVLARAAAAAQDAGLTP
jgi:uncharacterized protein (TIGR00299 family) protein